MKKNNSGLPGIWSGELADGTPVWWVEGRVKVTHPKTGKSIRRRRSGYLPLTAPRSKALALQEQLQAEARQTCLEELKLVERQSDGALVELPLTVSNFALRWLEDGASEWSEQRGKIIIATLDMHILPVLGHLTVEELHPRHLSEWWIKAMQARKPPNPDQMLSKTPGDLYRASTLRKWWALCKRLLSAFVIDQGCWEFGFVLDNHPTPDLRGRGQIRRLRLTLREARSVLEHIGGNGTVRDILEVVLDTGARTKEIRTLRWDQVDLERGELLLERTKTDVVRTATLFERSWTVLRERWARRGEAGVLSPLVFPAPRNPGQPTSDSTVRRALAWASGRAKLEQDLRPHTLRGVRATDLLARGLPTQMVQCITGHLSTSALAIYTRPTSAQLRELTEGLKREGGEGGVAP